MLGLLVKTEYCTGFLNCGQNRGLTWMLGCIGALGAQLIHRFVTFRSSSEGCQPTLQATSPRFGRRSSCSQLSAGIAIRTTHLLTSSTGKTNVQAVEFCHMTAYRRERVPTKRRVRSISGPCLLDLSQTRFTHPRCEGRRLMCTTPGCSSLARFGARDRNGVPQPCLLSIGLGS